MPLHRRLAPRFARPEPHHHALLYLQAVLSDIPRKNGWQVAEHAKQAHPYGMQRLLSRTVWDVDGIRDDLRAFVLECLGKPPSPKESSALPGDPGPILVLDESGFPKRGTKSAGVQKQSCGATGELPGGRLPLLRHLDKRGIFCSGENQAWAKRPSWSRTRLHWNPQKTDAGMRKTVSYQARTGFMATKDHQECGRTAHAFTQRSDLPWNPQT